MGFFSQECSFCHKSLLSPYSSNPKNEWMMHAVVLTPDGSLFRGLYDGYGRLETASASIEDAVGFDNEVYHKSCWEAAGKPTTFTKASKPAQDQGFFFDDEDYDIPDPLGRPAGWRMVDDTA